MPRRRRVPRWLLSGLGCAALGCGNKPPATQLQSAESWAATTRELAIQRRVDAVRRSYAEQLLVAGSENVRAMVRSIDPASLPPDTRTAVPGTLTRLATLMARTATSVRRGDMVALGAAAATADTLGDTLRALRKRVRRE